MTDHSYIAARTSFVCALEKYSLLILSLLVNQFSIANTIVGKIINENGQGVIAQIELNNHKLTTNDKGQFSKKIPNNIIYKVKVSANGYYPSIHHFSLSDITQSHIPDIELVRRKKGRTLLLFTGDVMMGRRFLNPADSSTAIIHTSSAYEDSKKILSHIKPYLEQADYTSINLESPILKDEPNIKNIKPYTFYSRPESLKALKWAGVDFVNLGNNHIYDYLDIGLKHTLQEVNKLTLGHVGAGLNEISAVAPTFININEQTFAFTRFVGWPGKESSRQVAKANLGGAAWGNEQNIANTFNVLKKHQGPSIIQYHGSHEYGEKPDETTKTRLQQAISQGADLAIGHHPHVTQGFDLYKDKLIAYSLGNFIFDQYHYGTQASMMLYVWMDGEIFHRSEIIPIYIDKYKPKPAISDINHYILNRVRYLSSQNDVGIYRSGAHGVITPKQSELSSTTFHHKITKNDTTHFLFRTPKITNEFSYISQIKSVDKLQVNKGSILLPISNFEVIDENRTRQCNWKALDGKLITTPRAAKHGLLGIKITSKQPKLQLMRKVRIYKDHGTISLNVWVKPKHSGKLQLSIIYNEIQGRIIGERKHRILPGIPIKENEWQQVDFEFNPPAYKNRGFTAIIHFTPEETEVETELMLDDIYFANWVEKKYIENNSIYNAATPYMGIIKLAQKNQNNNIDLVYKTIKRHYSL